VEWQINRFQKLFDASGRRNPDATRVHNKVGVQIFRGTGLIASLLLLAFPVALHGQKQEEFDEYKIRVDTGSLWTLAGSSASTYRESVDANLPG
jgi:hypothetical protein